VVDVTAADPGTDDTPDITGNPVPVEPQPLDVAGLIEVEVTPPPLNTLLGLAGTWTGRHSARHRHAWAARGAIDWPDRSGTEPSGEKLA